MLVKIKQNLCNRSFYLLIILFGMFAALPTFASKNSCANFNKIFKLTKMNAENGVIPSKFILGKMYHDGQCIPRDFHAARKWLLEAARSGHADSMYYLALVFYNAGGPYNDYDQAFFWFQKARRLGNASSIYYIAEIYLHGRGVKKNKNEAKRLLMMASSNNDPRAQFKIGSMYHKGSLNGRRNLPKAFDWYTRAALLGHGAAHYRLGQFYSKGMGVRRDKVKAFTWYSIADLHGYINGKSKKNEMYKRLSAKNIAEAQGLIQRYMKSMSYPEF